MKPSHTTTPRQLADCTFVEGHQQALSGPHMRSVQRHATWAERVVYLLFAGFLAWLFGMPLLVHVLGRL